MSDDARDTCCRAIGTKTWLELAKPEVVVEAMGDKN